MPLILPGLATLETTADHLRVPERRLRALIRATPLARIAPVALGRARGSYRLLPQLGLAALRQALSPVPRRLPDWEAALAALLASEPWRTALARVIDDSGVPSERGGRAPMERVLLSRTLQPAMAALHRESLMLLDRYDLRDQVQIEDLLVDRIEDEDDAVILIGDAQRAYAVPRPLLRMAGLEREGARGILIATRTGVGVDLDVWPAVGEGDATAWAPDPALLDLRVDVGAAAGA